MRLSWRQVSLYLAARVLPALAGLALTLLCIQALPPEIYATYSLTLLTAGVAAALVGGTSAQAMLRYANELSPAALRRGLVTLPLLAAAMASPFAIAYLAWRVGMSGTAWLAAALVPALALMDTRRSFFIARGRAGAVFALDTLRAGAAVVMAVLLLWRWPGQAAAPMFAQAASVLLCLLVLRPSLAAVHAPGRRKVDLRYVGYGAGLAGWMAVIVGMSLAERSLVANSDGLAASGRYAAQADLVNAVFAATGGALASALMPAYLALGGQPDAGKTRRLLAVGLLGALAAGGLCVLLGVAVSLAPAGALSAGLAADPATALTLVAAGAVWMAAGFVQKPLELRGQSARILACVLLSLLAFVLIAPGLAARLGPAGVALAKLLAGLCFSLLVLAAARWRH